MARTDNDTWDLASSVGATATMVAAARAAASRAPGALIDDPYAEPLVRAVGLDFFTRLAGGELRVEELDTDELAQGIRRLTDNMAARTRFFDDFFTDTAAAGVRQAVILAAGLDSRAYRLAWPAGSVVYEIDQPEVIEFKRRTLAELGAEPAAGLRPVAVDLRHDWPAALTAAGFDPAAPTAWSAEGLFGYLPPEAQDRLLDTVTALSAPGSRVAVEAAPSIDPADHARAVDRMRATAEQWRRFGVELDFADLVYLGRRNDPADYLAERGWDVTRLRVDDLLRAHGLATFDGSPDDPDAQRFGELQYVRGVR